MNKEVYLLVEDDCAPDAREYFEKKLLSSFGLTIENFKEKGVKISTQDDECVYSYNGYRLEQSAHDPYWHLSKVEVVEDKDLHVDYKAPIYIKLANVHGIIQAKEGGVINLDEFLVDFVKFLNNKEWDIENLHLCTSCEFHPAECGVDDMKFGTGKGNDNIYSCKKYTFKK